MKVKLLITDETKWVAYGPCRVVQLFGNNNTAADVYLQFHEKPLVSANDVPAVASIFCPASAPFDFKFSDPISLSELTIAASSTNDDYGALSDAGVDATVIVETDFPVGSNTTLVGNLTTNNISSRQIWTSASGTTTPKRLLRVDVINGDAVPIYARISASDSKLSGDTSNIPFEIDASATKNLYFGRAGIRPFRIDNGTGTEHKGCTVFLLNSADPGSGLIAVPTGTIRAIYDI